MCLHPIDFCSIVHNSQINGGEKTESALYLICFYWRRVHLSWRTWNLISFKRLLRILQLLCLLALGAKLYNSMFAKTILDTKSNSQKPSHRNIHLISLLPQSTPQDRELLQGKIYIYIITQYKGRTQRAPALCGVQGRVSVASLTLACAMRGDRDSNPGPSGHRR